MRRKTEQSDWVIACHEAAHAVTAEHLAPGCMVRLKMDADPDEVVNLGMAESTVAYCEFLGQFFSGVRDQAAMIYAGRWAEERVGWFDHTYTCSGDYENVRRYTWRWARSSYSKRAKRLVDELWPQIEKLAVVLLERRDMNGSEVREVLCA